MKEKMNQDFDSPVNRIYVSDARIILKEFPDNFVHLVFTSPPYNTGHNYKGYSDYLSKKDYNDLLETVFKEIRRILISGGSL